jgi:hypothetical protein
MRWVFFLSIAVVGVMVLSDCNFDVGGGTGVRFHSEGVDTSGGGMYERWLVDCLWGRP